jgi:hypothetical protein
MSMTKVMSSTVLMSYIGGLSFLILSRAPIYERIVIIPILNGSAYVSTVMIYACAGIMLWSIKKLRWKSIFPILTMAGIQEISWNVPYSMLNPQFVSKAVSSNPHWPAYMLMLFILTPILLFIQIRKLHFRFRPSRLTLVFPAYYLTYMLIGMPTSSSGHLFETAFIITLMISYINTIDEMK